MPRPGTLSLYCFAIPKMAKGLKTRGLSGLAPNAAEISWIDHLEGHNSQPLKKKNTNVIALKTQNKKLNSRWRFSNGLEIDNVEEEIGGYCRVTYQTPENPLPAVLMLICYNNITRLDRRFRTTISCGERKGKRTAAN